VILRSPAGFQLGLQTRNTIWGAPSVIASKLIDDRLGLLIAVVLLLKTQEQPLDHALLGFDEYLVATNYIALSVSALLAGDRAVAGGDVHACLRASAKLVLVSPDNVSSSTCTRLISRCPMPIRTN